ncbi:MAG: TonB family protein [Kangiellaceae bacterium]|jgi:protein TonB|nr:TonB family protein [Kangiellaceae bacterium]
MIEDGVVKSQGPEIRESDRLTFAAILALAFHGLLFMGIVFVLPEEQSQPASQSMQVVLAQYHSDQKPDKADFKGQANQQGGGLEDVLQNPTTTELAKLPDPNKQAAMPSAQMASAMQNQPMAEVLTGQSDNQVFLQEQIEVPDESNEPLLDTATLLQKSYELAGSNASIDNTHQQASRNLRKRQVSAAIHQATDALYLDSWRRRIEEVGNQNYPTAARDKQLYGDLLMKVAVNANGTIRDITIIESSGHKVLDDAAISIVRLAAPFDAFDQALQKTTDVLEIVRLWQFQPGDRVSTR